LFSASPDSGFSKHTQALVVLLKRLVELSALAPGADKQVPVVNN
jgi:hypothetical protein